MNESELKRNAYFMDVPKKLRLLNRFGKIFPVWSLCLQAKVIENAFDSEVAEADRKGKNAMHSTSSGITRQANTGTNHGTLEAAG
jgi:anthranilate/para-aminobenzoate synthase component II